MIETGTILQNRYRIDKQIGQGGMGTVFVATDQRFGSTVAIKKTFFEDEKLNKAFEREARLLNGLKHPALPKVSDYFNEESGQFIVMEFIAGEDLSETMEKSDRAFPTEDVLNWADQLCDALNYLHNQEMPVIHRDIKPQNLKLTPGGQVILLDFGLAKGNPTDASHKTAAKSIFGYSRNYASLEQIQGTGTDPQSDLYSLAATVYHLMTGIPPADALTRAMNVLNGQPDPLVPANLINRKIPKAVAAVLQKSMALNSGERPASAIELKSLLDRADKTSEPYDAEAGIATDYSTELLLQETKLMNQTTNLSVESASELQTEIQDIKLSESEINDSPKTVVARPRRALFIGATALSGFLVIGGMTFYLSDSNKHQTDPQTDYPGAQKNLLQTAGSGGNVSDAPDANQSTANADTVFQNDNSAENPTTAEQTKKPGETPKTPGAAPKTGADVSRDPVEPELTVVDKEGRVRVINDKVETDEFIIDENGVRPKDPSKHPEFVFQGGRPPAPEEFRKLTPKQKQKLLELMRERERRQPELEKPPLPPKQNQPANN